jgi:biopolymer transport protein TolR
MAMGITRNGRKRRGRAPMAEINVTPLVDVMLVLLIIFMVTAPLLTAGVPIDLPDSRAKALAQEPRQVTVAIGGDGQVYLDNVELARGELPGRLASLPRDAQGKPPLVVLRADRSLDYGHVMGVMGELNRAGITAISLVTNGSVEAP